MKELFSMKSKNALCGLAMAVVLHFGVLAASVCAGIDTAQMRQKNTNTRI
jgi:hypothetical protein